MASPVFNVTRWTVFASGIAYGLVHDRSLASKAHEDAAEAKLAKQAELIKQARAEWARLHPKPASAAAAEVNLDDPNFDPAKWIDHQVSQLGN